MKTKGKYKEKQRGLLKVWVQKCSNLATVYKQSEGLITAEQPPAETSRQDAPEESFS